MKKRRKRKIRFIVVLWLSILAIGSKAQKPVSGHTEILVSQPAWKTPLLGKTYKQMGIIQPNSFFTRTGLMQTSMNFSPKIYPPDSYVSHLPFFCKKEWELEKSVHIPLRFRVGSLADCNYLEGKGR